MDINMKKITIHKKILSVIILVVSIIALLCIYWVYGHKRDFRDIINNSKFTEKTFFTDINIDNEYIPIDYGSGLLTEGVRSIETPNESLLKRIRIPSDKYDIDIGYSITPQPHIYHQTWELGKYIIIIKSKYLYWDVRSVGQGPSTYITQCEISIQDTISKEYILDFNSGEADYGCGGLENFQKNGQLMLFVSTNTVYYQYQPESNYVYFYDGEDLHLVTPVPIDITNENIYNLSVGFDKKGIWYWTVYDARYYKEFYNFQYGSSESYVPRVYSIDPSGGSVKIKTGSDVSRKVKQGYRDELNNVKYALSKISLECLKNYYSMGSVDNNHYWCSEPGGSLSVPPDTFAKWIGLARISLSGKQLRDELKVINEFENKYGTLKREGRTVEDIYSDIKIEF